MLHRHRAAPRINKLRQVAVAQARDTVFFGLFRFDGDPRETGYRIEPKLLQSLRDVARQLRQRLRRVLVAWRETRIKRLAFLFSTRSRRFRIARFEGHVTNLNLCNRILHRLQRADPPA